MKEPLIGNMSYKFHKCPRDKALRIMDDHETAGKWVLVAVAVLLAFVARV